VAPQDQPLHRSSPACSRLSGMTLRSGSEGESPWPTNVALLGSKSFTATWIECPPNMSLGETQDQCGVTPLVPGRGRTAVPLKPDDLRSAVLRARPAAPRNRTFPLCSRVAVQEDDRIRIHLPVDLHRRRAGRTARRLDEQQLFRWNQSHDQALLSGHELPMALTSCPHSGGYVNRHLPVDSYRNR
jgi:hypothetical protein